MKYLAVIQIRTKTNKNDYLILKNKTQSLQSLRTNACVKREEVNKKILQRFTRKKAVKN